jgi:uncharacterized repeat protein (TIGR03803 family)
VKRVGCAGILTLSIALATSGLAQVQERVLYSFCSAAGCTDGNTPHAKLVFDTVGNLYGTTIYGGSNCQQDGGGGCGTVFELSPASNGPWTENVIYSFCANSIQNCPDGAEPWAGLTFDKAGNLYGTTNIGGVYGLGTVFQLTPPSSQGGSWTETVLWSFGAPGDGKSPLSHLIFDASGDLYGTTSAGGTYGGGTVFQLVPTNGGQWSENVLLSFGPDPFNGYSPRAGVALDKSGNLYGTTFEGGTKDGFGWGVVYELSPNPRPPWTETVLFRFTKKTGANPLSVVNFDSLGNLYGTLSDEGPSGYGGVFRITPQGREHTIPFGGTPDGEFPAAGVFVHGDALYGTTQMGGSGQNGGTLFKIRGTAETVLYSFCSQPGCADGNSPQAALISRTGSLYGTTFYGGANGNGGVVFQIFPPARPASRAKSGSGRGTRPAKIHSVDAGSP